jgi:hypothetical protein
VYSVSALKQRTRLRVPDLSRVLSNGAVARKFPGAGDIQNRPVRPSIRVRIELAEPLIRIGIGPEIRQMHVVVAVRKLVPLAS